MALWACLRLPPLSITTLLCCAVQVSRAYALCRHTNPSPASFCSHCRPLCAFVCVLFVPAGISQRDTLYHCDWEDDNAIDVVLGPASVVYLSPNAALADAPRSHDPRSYVCVGIVNLENKRVSRLTEAFLKDVPWQRQPQRRLCPLL